MFKINPIRFTRLFTFSWCFCTMIFFQVYATVLLASVTHSMNSIVITFGFMFGIAIAYIPMVFLAIFPSTILEAVVEGKGEQLTISSSSWQGSLGLMGSPGSSLCVHCWIMPARMFTTVYTGGFICVAFMAVLVIRSLWLLIFTAFVVCMGRKIRSWKDFVDVVTWERKFNCMLKPKPVKDNHPRHKKNPWAIIFEFSDKIVSTIVTVKNRACPTLRWK